MGGGGWGLVVLVGELCMRWRTHMHGEKAHTGLPACAHFIRGVEGEAERGPRGGVGTGAGAGVVHGDKSPLPPLAWREVNLKGCSVSPRQTGVRRGAGRLNLRRAVAPLANTGSSTLPSYP